MANANIYTAALMEHNAHPDYKYEMDDPTHVHQGVNPSCGDDITVSLHLEDGIIDEAAFQGSGCAVSQASADIMADLITDKTPGESQQSRSSRPWEKPPNSKASRACLPA